MQIHKVKTKEDAKQLAQYNREIAKAYPTFYKSAKLQKEKIIADVKKLCKKWGIDEKELNKNMGHSVI